MSREWAFQEFGHAAIADRRLGRRAVQMAARAARRPAGRVTEVFSGDDERQGAYGLLESAAVGSAALTEAMAVAATRRAADEEFVFCPVDGTSLTLTDRALSKDFGPIGSRAQGARGIKVINAMLLSPTGVPIGVCAQQWWVRAAVPRKQHHQRVAPEAKEIGRWRDAMDQTREVMAKHAPETRCWFQLDREGDAWAVLEQAGNEAHWFTVRASWNRRVQGNTYLRPLVAKQPVRSTYPLEVRAAPKRSARIAKMEIRGCAVVLRLKDKKTGKVTPLAVNVVQAVEVGTTPPEEKPIEWMLLTNRPIETTEHLAQIVLGYSMRWRIEELHRCWKSGACRVEETQLHSSEAVIKWATILIAVAVRIERIKHLARREPDRPATDEFTPVELEAIVLLRFDENRRGRPAKGVVPTIEEATRWVAQIGGYVYTRSAGPPGSVTIARGLKEVRVAVRALQALRRRSD